MTTLTASELTAALRKLPDWAAEGAEIVKIYRFADFVAAIAFVNRVAPLAEEAGHHPDIDIRYNRVRIALATHDEGSITARDTALAARLDSIGR